MKIKKGDNIIVISGKDRGKQGKIIKVLPNNEKVIVENINLKKKHQRPKTGGKKGEKIEVPRPIPSSTVALICKNCGKPTRIGRRVLPTQSVGGPDGLSAQTGKKIRICKKCGLET